MSTAEIVATAGTDLAQEQQRVHKALARRKVLVYTLRIGILVVTLGAWELAARAGWIDPFFFSMPSQIVDQMWVWATEGTSQGSVWEQVLVKVEETLLGFGIGAVAGVIAGIALGRNQLLAGGLRIHIQVANSIPRVLL